mmetsp:Transcript_70546/g.168454  ORF Transcript_70546/g.168454 Transcript_70546/m.168454 type:complete len:242 (+) Transcript_70546:1025-1750(+)
MPQWFGLCTCSRCRVLKDGRQLAEQADQCSHWPHCPSSHSASQLCVLQSPISEVFSPPQDFPPFSGYTWMVRRRRFSPPPQVQEQSLHASQSLHWQSRFGHAWVLQGATSARSALQLWLPFSARCRSMMPPPQSSEQGPHKDQVPSLQSPGSSQLAGPQDPISSSTNMSCTKQLPLLSSTSRLRTICPSQEAEHSPQSDQSVMLHSVGSAVDLGGWQGSVSFTGKLQWPPPVAGSTMGRSR